jgi:hypothetical protein
MDGEAYTKEDSEQLEVKGSPLLREQLTKYFHLRRSRTRSGIPANPGL